MSTIARVRGDSLIEYPVQVVGRLAEGEEYVSVLHAPSPGAAFYAYTEGTPVRLDDGAWHRTWIAAPLSIEVCRASLHAAVLAKRGELERQGVPYEFPDGLLSTIQTRGETDIRNIQGNTTAALVMQAQGMTDPVLTFRTEDNVNHALTPSEAIAMGMAVAARVQGLYAFKWGHDEAIEALLTVDDCEAYDTTLGWGDDPVP